jgi:VanZ family protein
MSRLMALNARLWPLVTLALAAAITVLSLLPMPDLPVPSEFLAIKSHHFIAYAALAFPVALARPRLWPVFLVLIAGWGGMIEILQPYFGRTAGLFDAFVNAVGVTAGALAAAIVRRLAGTDRPASPARAGR